MLTAKLGPLVYQAAFHLPVLCTFTSLYELFRKALLARTYPNPQIGQTYQTPSHRYYVEKSYTELACPLVWGFGHIALAWLKNDQKVKGEAFFKKGNLETAALRYRHPEALYQHGIICRNQKNYELAADCFTESRERGFPGSSLALGQLYLAGVIGDKNTAIEHAIACFQREEGAFSTYQTALASAMEQCSVTTKEALFKKYLENGFSTTFSEAEVIDFPILIGNSQELALAKETKRAFYNCALLHLPSDFQKMEAYYGLYQLDKQIADLEKAAELGHIQARRDLSLILRGSTKAEEHERALDHEKALTYLSSIQNENRTPEDSITIGHFYLTGFGTICSPNLASTAYIKVPDNTEAAVDAKYFDALAQMLIPCDQSERAEFCLAANAIDQTIRWKTTIPTAGEPATFLDLSSAIAEKLLAKLIDFTNNSLLIRDQYFDTRASLAQKLLAFSGTNALAPCLKSSALLKLANLHTLLGKIDEAIADYVLARTHDTTESEPLMKLYELYVQRRNVAAAHQTLEEAAKAKYPPAQFLLGEYLRHTYPPGNSIKPSEAARGQTLILAAARSGYEDAVTYCQQQQWSINWSSRPPKVPSGAAPGTSVPATAAVNSTPKDSPPRRRAQSASEPPTVSELVFTAVTNFFTSGNRKSISQTDLTAAAGAASTGGRRPSQASAHSGPPSYRTDATPPNADAQSQ